MTSRVARLTNSANRWPRLAAASSRIHARAYQLTRGRGVGSWFGAPVMVLETVGRKSGRLRRTPILYLRDGERLVVMAAAAGSDRVPAWWLNLAAAGEGVVEVAGRRARIRPRETEGEERARLWVRFAAMYPPVDDYLTMTERHLPLIVLEPV